MIKQFIKLKFLGLLFLGTGLFAQIANRPNDVLVKQSLMASSAERTLLAEDMNYAVTDFHSSKKSGVQHIYLRQTYNGLEIVGTESSIHLSSTGQVASVNNQFINSLEKRAGKVSSNPQLDAKQAVVSVASQLGYSITKDLRVLSQGFNSDRMTRLSDGGISKSEIPVRLMYYLKEDKSLALVWELSIQSNQEAEWYNVWVDASNGQIIEKNNWINSCGFDHAHEEEDFFHFQSQPTVKESFGSVLAPEAIQGSYMVFAMPLESPYFGDRTLLLADDVVNTNASPYGWHDTNGSPGPEYTTTRGNNVNAYEDGDNYGFQPNGGNNLVFNFPFNQNYSYSNQYESAAITNLFYWNNIIHDVFYEYGFDEASGNFQQNNYGKGGLGNDFVFAEAQDNESTCNANFGTPPDGQNPVMQMFICGNKDGDYDNLVIIHEYGHGITNRLTGGAGNVNCLNSFYTPEQMGEGWGDWFGMMMTMKAGDQRTDPRTVGTYLFGQGPGGAGIRQYPYSTNMNVNPHTYNSIKNAAVPHGVGSVWAVMLWDMTWDLIDQHGFDPDIYNGTGGNNIALHLVVEALKLQPCSPGFVDGRDAILLADQLLYGGENQCLIWNAFARRGLGFSANQGSSGSTTDGTQAFDTPSDTAAFVAPDDVCVDKGLMTGLGGGTPFGGVYSGPGVTDDGNGSTYTFDPTVAGIGVHTIKYSVAASSCAPASSDTDQIEVTEGLMAVCPNDIQVETSDSNCSAVVAYAMPEGVSGCKAVSGENFDQVNRPNLPQGWTTSSESGSNNLWTTVNSQSSSSPNAAFASNRSSTSLSSLASPEFAIEGPNAKLKFKFSYNTESSYDGAVLEYSMNNGAWSDILNGGGTFVSGGYNGSLSTSYGNPLGGRQAWTGSSNGFVSVEVNLSAAMNGKNVKFRWRMGSDSGYSQTGVWLDNVEIEGISSPVPTVTQIAGLASGSQFPLGTTTNTFEIKDGAGNVKTCSFDVVVNDATAPVLTCPADQTVEVAAGATYSLPDYWAEGGVTAVDNCSTLAQKTQSPMAGTALSVGTHTIEFSVKDAAGNVSNCSFELTVDGTLGLNELSLGDAVQIHPNPTDNFVTISSTQKIAKVVILDMSGKKVHEARWDNSSTENTYSIKHLPTGTYLIQIVGEKQTVVKKMIKK